jgi:antitoxin component of RelBE/YafQ-DinJ toxin-antitoxin module
MSPAMTNFRIDPDLLEALRAIRQRDGLPISEQIRRAIRAWVEHQGIDTADRRLVPPRKRS